MSTPEDAPATDNKICKRIATLRKRKRWSQAALAEAAHVSREAIGKYERGVAVPSVETARRIADAFDVTLDYLAGDSEAGAIDRETLARVQELQALPDDDREHVLAVVDAFLRDVRIRRAYAA